MGQCVEGDVVVFGRLLTSLISFCASRTLIVGMPSIVVVVANERYR